MSIIILEIFTKIGYITHMKKKLKILFRLSLFLVICYVSAWYYGSRRIYNYFKGESEVSVTGFPFAYQIEFNQYSINDTYLLSDVFVSVPIFGQQVNINIGGVTYKDDEKQFVINIDSLNAQKKFNKPIYCVIYDLVMKRYQISLSPILTETKAAYVTNKNKHLNLQSIIFELGLSNEYQSIKYWLRFIKKRAHLFKNKFSIFLKRIH